MPPPNTPPESSGPSLPEAPPHDVPGLPLSAFAADDQALIRLAYETVKGVCDLWQSMRDVPDFPRFREAVLRLDDLELIDKLQALGRATMALGADTPLVRKICHDILGGRMTALVGTAGLLKAGVAYPKVLEDCVLFARDHAEFMRKVVTDLDPGHLSPELPLHQPATLSGEVDQL